MLDFGAALLAMAAMLALTFAAWPVSVAKHDVGIVDSLWSLFFVAGAAVYALCALRRPDTARAACVAILLVVWAARLCAYVTWRNFGEPEDRRYQAIRARNEPGFAWKSAYLVFALQAVLAWIVALPVLAALTSVVPFNALDWAGLALWMVGFAFESVGDQQLANFKADPANRGQVLERGLWRYTRHPNYFGEATLWWGFFLFAAAAGAWWTVLAPLVMTVLLLKVSGVALLEKDIGERRAAYRDYVLRTSAFIPLPPKRPTASMKDAP